MYLFVQHIGTVNHTFRGMPSLVPSERPDERGLNYTPGFSRGERLPMSYIFS